MQEVCENLRNSKGMLSRLTKSIPYARTVRPPNVGRDHGALCPVQYPFIDGSCAVWGTPARSHVPEIWFASLEHLLRFYSLHVITNFCALPCIPDVRVALRDCTQRRSGYTSKGTATISRPTLTTPCDTKSKGINDHILGI
jgi:hypothetical protein